MTWIAILVKSVHIYIYAYILKSALVWPMFRRITFVSAITLCHDNAGFVVVIKLFIGTLYLI